MRTLQRVMRECWESAQEGDWDTGQEGEEIERSQEEWRVLVAEVEVKEVRMEVEGVEKEVEVKESTRAEVSGEGG